MASVCLAVVLCSSAESSQVSQRESYGFSVFGCSPVLISRVSQVSQRESYGFSVLGCSPVLISRVESGESERELWLQCVRL